MPDVDVDSKLGFDKESGYENGKNNSGRRR